jgi:predicted ferric reductase
MKRGWILLVILLVMHATIWLIALAVEPTLIPAQQLIAERFSTFAVVLMSLNLMLVTRARPLERGLDGLDKLFAAHRLNGLTVALVVTSHFLLVPKSVGYVPSKPIGYTMLPLLLLAIFIASAPRFPWRRLVPLRYQTWKATHRFQGLFVAAAVWHSLVAPSFTRTSVVLRPWVYGLAGLGLLAWAYRELLFSAFGPFRAHTVSATRHVGPDVLEVSLASTTERMQRTAGQFVFVSFAEGPSREQHPFTVSSGPAADLRFSIKASGDFTQALLTGVPAGSAARIEGPYGRFDFKKGRERQLWLAGGIGITPFLSMATALDPARRVTLVWSVRKREEPLYIDELEALAAANPGLSVVVHPTSELGHLKLETLASPAGFAETSAFICGPLPMRQEFLQQLRALGVRRRDIYYEEFRLR